MSKHEVDRAALRYDDPEELKLCLGAGSLEEVYDELMRFRAAAQPASQSDEARLTREVRVEEMLRERLKLLDHVAMMSRQVQTTLGKVLRVGDPRDPDAVGRRALEKSAETTRGTLLELDRFDRQNALVLLQLGIIDKERAEAVGAWHAVNTWWRTRSEA